ncbi:hypothetical protein PG999_005766 [Apiospora kogelbergensis]|uniref:Zn(2)-C6 fungal-type domain-containing protein n=1 Tax=Apiospora kogelbergensis TaxID=1337665 RepID=A0AAW0QQE0_9PEZI
MSPSQSQAHNRSLSTARPDVSRASAETGSPAVQTGSADMNGFSLHSSRDGLSGNTAPHSLIDAPDFQDFSFPYQEMPEGAQMMGLEDHATDMFGPSGGEASLASIGDGKDSIASGAPSANFTATGHSERRQSHDASEGESPGGTHAGVNSLEDDMSDEFGLSAGAPGDGTDMGRKDSKSDITPAWSELKTKAGKERKRLPLACIACRRKKIRCSGEKPACKHCIRSRIPCVYKVTTRKAAPRTDYMTMLDKRLKRMEDRIIKIVPKSEQDATAANVTRANLKPGIIGALSAGKQVKKRGADEAFGNDLDHWSRTSSKAKPEDSRPASLQVQEREDGKLLTEGREALPPMDIREHLAEVFFENIYGQVYHLLHKPSYMRKLKADTLPPVLVLSVCAISARFSTHPMFAAIPNFLRGEEWAGHARDIVTRRYEWPNITVLTCLLILGLHEFGTCHGGRSWSLGGQAIRMAFALQLHKDLEFDPTRSNPNAQLSFIDREVRRRTMWACFLMDRFNSSGTDRPMFIREETVRIQLPIKEKLFQLDMPGPTEDLDGEVPHPVPVDEGQLSNPKDNMGVAAYMIRTISLWGKIISFLNQGGKDIDNHTMWEPDSDYSKMLKQAEDFAAALPEGLKYSAENLRLHDTEGMANQFLFLHISIQQNILFMNRFAVSSPAGLSNVDVPKNFITKAGAKAFGAANRISDLLRDSESFFIAAPFVGYCAFLSSTVHIFGIFSGNVAVEQSAKKNLATNVRFLGKMKRYWGMFHFMSENLREQYRVCADAHRQGTPATENATASPIFQYGDWFDRYPHGVSSSDFLDPAGIKKKESGDDAVLEQKPETYTVEELFAQLSPPQSAETREAAASGTQSRPQIPKRKSVASISTRKNGMPPRSGSQHLEPLLTDLNPNILPEHVQQRLHHQRQQYAARLSSQQRNAAAGSMAAYHALSPISPIGAGHGHGHGHPHFVAAHSHHSHHGLPGLYDHDLVSLGLANNPSGMMPHLDRQLVFGAYGGIDPTTISGQEAMINWDALAGTNHHAGGGNGANVGGGGEGGPSGLPSGYHSEPSSAWFMPFNMEAPELGQDVATGMASMEGFGGMFSPGGMTPGSGLGLRRNSHR